MSAGSHLDAAGYGYREEGFSRQHKKMRQRVEIKWGIYWQSSF